MQHLETELKMRRLDFCQLQFVARGVEEVFHQFTFIEDERGNIQLKKAELRVTQRLKEDHSCA